MKRVRIYLNSVNANTQLRDTLDIAVSDEGFGITYNDLVEVHDVNDDGDEVIVAQIEREKTIGWVLIREVNDER